MADANEKKIVAALEREVADEVRWLRLEHDAERGDARLEGSAPSRDAVLRFYGETLPQLGWRPVGGDAFLRNGEKLQIEFPRRPPGRGLGVRILITPG